MPGEAEVKYLDGDFRVVRPGAFVRCAVTGEPIPLEELRYWSVDLQEAYATPEAVLQRAASGYARKAQTYNTVALCRLQNHPAEWLGFLDHKPHRQGAGAAGERLELRLAGNPHEILLGRDQHQALGLRAREQIPRLRHRIAVMVGKACAFGDLDAGRGQRRKEFPGIADAGKGQNFAPADGRDDAAIGLRGERERSPCRAGARDRGRQPRRPADRRRRAPGRDRAAVRAARATGPPG